MDPSNLNILVEAKKEYLAQLYIAICPTMIEVFEEMYKESQKMSKGRRVLLQYQKLLKEVINWNEHMIHKHTENVCNSCSWFNDLLAAVFVSTVKILSSVRLNTSENNKISLKLPNNKVFIHGCFIAAAKDLYKNPYVYHEESVEQERDIELTNRFSRCIEDTVKEMIPIQEILKSCMSQMKKDEPIDFDNSMPEDSEDPDFMNEEEGEGEGEEEEEEPVEELQETSEEVGDVKKEEEEEDTKDIDLNSKKEESLFDDAPEK